MNIRQHSSKLVCNKNALKCPLNLRGNNCEPRRDMSSVYPLCINTTIFYPQKLLFSCLPFYLFVLSVDIDVALLPINSESKFLLADKFDTFD